MADPEFPRRGANPREVKSLQQATNVFSLPFTLRSNKFHYETLFPSKIAFSFAFVRGVNGPYGSTVVLIYVSARGRLSYFVFTVDEDPDPVQPVVTITPESGGTIIT